MIPEFVPPPAFPAPRYAFHASRTGSGAVVVVARGEVDASNCGELLDLVDCVLRSSRNLVLDCSAVGFFAVEGFTMLQRVNVMCARSGAGWVLLPSASVHRVLAVCGPGSALVPVCFGGTGVGSRRLRLVRGG